jgi:hypothetical protein
MWSSPPIWLLFAVILIDSCATCLPSSSSAAWLGLEHRWLRHEVRIVPVNAHRVSLLANLITPAAAASSAASGAFVAFAPGVDGDFSHPSITFAPLPTNVSFVDVLLAWSDNSTVDDHGFPAASSCSEAHVPSVWPASALQGFTFSSHCDPAKQPPGRVCNSNGIWPTQLSVALLSGGSQVQMCIDRAWSPDGVYDPFGKPYDWRMDYNVTVRVALIESGPVTASGLPVRLSANSTLWHGAAATAGYIAMNGTWDPAAVFVWPVITGFGFELVLNGSVAVVDKLPHGRYLGGITARVTSAVADASGAGVFVNATVGPWSPPDNWPIGTRGWIDVTAVSTSVIGDLAPPLVVATGEGTVCVSGDPGLGPLAFDCAKEGLPDRDTDSFGLGGQ